MSFNICRGTLGNLAMFTAIRNASSRDMCLNPTVRVTCWLKFVIICPRPPINCRAALWSKLALRVDSRQRSNFSLGGYSHRFQRYSDRRWSPRRQTLVGKTMKRSSAAPSSKVPAVFQVVRQGTMRIRAPSRQVHRKTFEIGKRAVSQGSLMSSAQDYAGCPVGLKCFLPARCT